jgi:hypothetical protein
MPDSAADLDIGTMLSAQVGPRIGQCSDTCRSRMPGRQFTVFAVKNSRNLFWFQNHRTAVNDVHQRSSFQSLGRWHEGSNYAVTNSTQCLSYRPSKSPGDYFPPRRCRAEHAATHKLKNTTPITSGHLEAGARVKAPRVVLRMA